MDLSFLDKLNEHQLRAVLDENRACLVNANVGSGKTTVLIAKILYLHEVKSVPYQDMVVLTFTNKAANEIKERLVRSNPSLQESEMPYFGTFHSVALTLLRTVLDITQLGFTDQVTVIDPDEEVDIAAGLIVENGLNIKYANQLERRLELAREGKYLFSVMKKEDDIRKLITLLQKEKKRLNKMNFDDLIVFATKLLPSSDFRPLWIVIDEFQDTNAKQMRFIDAMHSEGASIFAVGDPNQIIYSWRGSARNLFKLFTTRYHAMTLTLPKNYRSCKSILDVARPFLEKDTGLSGVREAGEKITVRSHYNAFQEAQYLAEEIRRLVQEGISYREIAVFYRFQRQAQTLSDVFGKENIPYEISMRKTLKDIPVLRWFIQLLRAAVNPLDTDSIVAVICNPQYGDGISKRKAKQLLSAIPLEGDTTGSRDATATLNAISTFSEWCNYVHDYDELFEFFGLSRHLHPTSATYNRDRQYIEGFLERIKEYSDKKALFLFEGVQEYINSSALYGIDVVDEDLHIDRDTVKLMTLHAAKGLEFKQVYIIGNNDGLIPMKTADPDEEREERRLFFVGITRAKDNLELSYYTCPDELGVFAGPSKYLSMIPDYLLDRKDTDAAQVDLQAYRDEIRRNREEYTTGIPMMMTMEPPKKRVRHPKYGTGVVLSENEETIKVDFDDYGEKELIKAFTVLEEL